MKKIIIALLCLLLCLTTGVTLAEAVEIEGVIEPARTLSLRAPHSGMAGDIDVAAGDVLAAGDALLALSTTKVYADFDGTVTGVFAEPGDSAASVENRYGALLYMEREELYTASCTTNGSHSDNEDKIVHVGETVYIQSTNDNKRDGVAIVTRVSGKEYTLDVTLIDDLKVTDAIKVYRDSDHDSDSCIGSGKISRIDPVPVMAEGYVLAVHVQDGDAVSRGDVLLEIVPDALDNMLGGDGVIRMPQDGVLLSVNASAGEQIAKDQTVAAYCPAGEVELVCHVDEEDLSQLFIGDSMMVTLEAMGDAQIGAAVTKISAAADENGEFAVTLTLDETEGVYIGMTATAKK